MLFFKPASFLPYKRITSFRQKTSCSSIHRVTIPTFQYIIPITQPLNIQQENQMALDVFIPYSHKDRALRDELATHLSNLRRQGLINDWYDGDIAPGTEWKEQILTRLNKVQLILLLISADFM